MVQYDLKHEFMKIIEAFKRVKQDYVSLNTRISVLEKENIALHNLIGKTKTEVKINDSKEELFIGNKDSSKIHSEMCPYAKKISQENRIYFDTINDALKSNYIRCSCTSK